MSKNPNQIMALVREAGVIGAAGMGYPTYAKLQCEAHTVIINGSECEPLLYTDKTLLRDRTVDVVDGLIQAMIASGAKRGVVALNAADIEGVARVEKELVQTPGLSLHLLGDYYPAGDEFNLVYEVTGKLVPEGGTPLDIGVLVLNVTTARQISQAVNGIAATERTVTIAGEVREPKVVTVPIGTRYSELIAMAGGPSVPGAIVLEGGPMMGRIVTDLEQGLAKSVGALVLLPPQHLVVRMKKKSVSEIVKQSKASSGQRMQSTDLCPRHLLGHDINPDRAMVALDYGRAEPSAAITAAYLCSDCGICELIGDESSFSSPRKIYQEYKSRLLRAGVANPHRRTDIRAHSQFENRKLAAATLIKKLDIGSYVTKPTVLSGKPVVNLVRVPLGRHVGAPAQAMVHTGQSVRRGDVIAASPEGFLGTIYHAPIHGKVTHIDETNIEVTGGVA